RVEERDVATLSNHQLPLLGGLGPRRAGQHGGGASSGGGAGEELASGHGSHARLLGWAYMGAGDATCQAGPRRATIPAMTSADVIVVGGGVVGASTAFHLAALSVRNVVLIEQRHLAAGASGKSGALVRMHYTNEAESRLAFESLKIFRDFATVVGGDCGFEPVGFFQIVGRGYEAALGRNVAAQQRLGIRTEAIAPDELARRLPGCRIDDVGAAAWEADSGFADPNATTFAFAEAARQRGIAVRTECAATRVVVEGGRVAGVETTAGRITAPIVVLAPGAWASRLLAP